jgi:crotonobetaine/carnitine-CoA ligase
MAATATHRNVGPPWSGAPHLTTVELMRASCERFPDRPALLFEDGLTVTRRELLDRAEAFAGFLRERVSPGERVAIMLGNRTEFLIAFFAVSAVRAVLVSLSPESQQHDAGYMLRDSQSVLVITEEEHRDVVEQVRAECPSVRDVLYLGKPEPCGFDDYAGDDSPPLAFGNAACDPADITHIYYTSGTTGPPKGCMLDHTWWRRVLDVSFRLNPKGPDDRVLCCLPFYYADPALFLLTTLHGGGSLVVMRKFSVSRFWPVVRDFGVTTFSSIGGMAAMLLKGTPSDAERDHKVKYVIGTGIPPGLHEALVERFGCPWLENYGSTEAGIGTRMPINYAATMTGSGSMGVATPETDIRIVDDDENDLPAGSVGQILVRNPGMFRGYLNREQETLEAMRGGWYHTGDLGRVDENGFYYFIGRIKDIIRRSGENVAAAEVEDVLRAHPKVRDAAVVPEPDEIRGEEVKAFVRLMPSESAEPLSPEELVEWCSRNLAAFKVPRYFVYRTSDFPRTPSLRVRKDELRRDQAPAWDRDAR